MALSDEAITLAYVSWGNGWPTRAVILTIFHAGLTGGRGGGPGDQSGHLNLTVTTLIKLCSH